MKTLFVSIAVLFLNIIFLQAQTVDYAFIKSIAAQTDSAAHASIQKSGYTALQKGEYQYIQDNKIMNRVYFVKGYPDGLQKHSYWAFQARGKKIYSDIFKFIKKGAVVKEGSRNGKPKTEYRAKDGLYYYPFEDSSMNKLYWIYASKESLLD